MSSPRASVGRNPDQPALCCCGAAGAASRLRRPRTPARQPRGRPASTVDTEIVIHVRGRDAAVLRTAPPVSEHAVTHLLDTAFISLLIHDMDGRPIDASPRRRTPTRRQRRILDEMHPTCARQGCTATKFLQADHIQRRSDGGPTMLANLRNLCGPHNEQAEPGATEPTPPGFYDSEMAGVLLCSAGLGAVGPWLDEHVGAARSVTFVDTAARPLDSAPFLDDCTRTLADLGCELRELDLTTANHDETSAALSRSSIVFVTGGYPIFLLQSAQRSGFLERARLAVRSGGLSYIGVSAGAALAGPTMEPLVAEDDPGDVTDYRALDLVDFVVLPHANRYPAEVFEARRVEWATRCPVRFLRDDRALSSTGGAVLEVESASRF